jgi:acetate kinase
MDYQILFNIAVAVAGFFGGWTLNRIYQAIDRLDADVRQMPTHYVARDDYRNDIRDIHQAANEGNADASLALEHLIDSIRHWVGAFAWQMGGVDALVFTAGIGENDHAVRKAVCAGLEQFGLVFDEVRNLACRSVEAELSADSSKVKVFVIPANEELVLAREVYRKISHIN